MRSTTKRYPWLWDVDMDNATFEAILNEKTVVGALDADWAMLRLIEYAPFRDIKQLLPFDGFIRKWPSLKSKVRSGSRRKGMEYWVAWRNQGEGIDRAGLEKAL